MTTISTAEALDRTVCVRLDQADIDAIAYVRRELDIDADKGDAFILRTALSSFAWRLQEEAEELEHA